MRYELDGQAVEFKMNVLRVGNEPVPADVIAIPAGAQRVKSRIIAVADELELLDHPLSPPKDH